MLGLGLSYGGLNVARDRALDYAVTMYLNVARDCALSTSQ